MIRIVIADDHEIIRDGLRTLFSKEADIKVIGEVSNGLSAVELVAETSPDVVIMDITMPDLNGIETARKITSLSPNTKIIALTMHSDRRFVMEMFKAGASGYILKDCAFDELSKAVHIIVKGHKYMSPKITDVVVDNCFQNKTKDESCAFSVLTSREREVLQLISEGWSTKKTAVKLHVSNKTIETHRSQIMKKLGIHNIADLTKYAIREGLTSLDM
ncbi:MAG: response regulator transcription factor [Planctomycetota bacterium]